MSDELRAILHSIMLKHGFDIDVTYATSIEMVFGIRQIERLSSNAILNDAQTRALLENLCAIIRRTASLEGATLSVLSQARQPRWRFLRAAAPDAADAYVEVLRYLQVEVPTSLNEEN